MLVGTTFNFPPKTINGSTTKRPTSNLVQLNNTTTTTTTTTTPSPSTPATAQQQHNTTQKQHNTTQHNNNNTTQQQNPHRGFSFISIVCVLFLDLYFYRVNKQDVEVTPSTVAVESATLQERWMNQESWFIHISFCDEQER
jgi:hypothetical protein